MDVNSSVIGFISKYTGVATLGIGDQTQLTAGIVVERGVIQHVDYVDDLPGVGKKLQDHIRSRADTLYHPVGTCRMGPVGQSETVVDPELPVHGGQSLRVADASIMPSIAGGNTNASTIMIAEKAADMIRRSG